MRFSKEFDLALTSKDDWFDTIPTQDSPLYVDPYLIFDDPDPFWSESYDHVVSFFELAADLVLKSGGQEDTPAWRKAERLLHFPEPKEFALGLAMASPAGSGTGKMFARRIATTLGLVGKEAVKDLSSIAGFALFCEGFGRDRTSDVLCNILKAKFIAYTQEVAARHDIPMSKVEVVHAASDLKRGSWSDLKVDLPVASGAGGVILTPRRFLKDIPRVTPDGFWDWAEHAEFAALRDDLNFDLSVSLTKSQKVEAARKVANTRPDIAISYLQKEASRAHAPYDVERDPQGLVYWYESGQKLAALADVSALKAGLPCDDIGFQAWVKTLAATFQYAVEESDGWRLLWNDDYRAHRPEKICQAVAGMMWRSECQAAGVDLSREVDMGRGPVDFKFSKGWTRRALLEVKYIGSTKFFSGAEKQLPQYLQTEGISFGIYLAVGFTDGDFRPERLKRVTDTCTALSAAKGVTIKPLFVDARVENKKSASTL
ncbi:MULTISPECIES: hypothetical protein [Micrococcaceae]|jgi:hypothetical protein|uniref:hypothetical protein n=1 Tax=Micrococcaceae TaxID=1268 RepID=UPI00209685DB|nr:hypothetical protein [Arthrobacter sp. H16F315]MDD1478732.1 hypothetical protein [Arthrobacter sp. H16F315]MDD1478780.1 hypothetical protein [Arthrobacter sp. H16F315]